MFVLKHVWVKEHFSTSHFMTNFLQSKQMENTLNRDQIEKKNLCAKSAVLREKKTQPFENSDKRQWS